MESETLATSPRVRPFCSRKCSISFLISFLTTSLYSMCIMGLDVDVGTKLSGILREMAFERDSYGAILTD